MTTLTKQDIKIIKDLLSEEFSKLNPRFSKLETAVINLGFKLDREVADLRKQIKGLPTVDQILKFRDDFATMYLKTREDQGAQLMLIRRNTERIEKIERKIP